MLEGKYIIYLSESLATLFVKTVIDSRAPMRTASECAKNGSERAAMQLTSESLRVAGLMSKKSLVQDKYVVQALAQ